MNTILIEKLNNAEQKVTPKAKQDKLMDEIRQMLEKRK